MLIGIDPLLGPDLLQVLAAMGHGDTIVVADANFPSQSMARTTVHGVPLRMDAPSPRAVQAVLSLMPLDTFGQDPVVAMQVVGDPAAVPPVVAEVAELIAPQGFAMASVERFAFYDLARNSYAILHTQETRLYGNFALRKGVIGP